MLVAEGYNHDNLYVKINPINSPHVACDFCSKACRSRSLWSTHVFQHTKLDALCQPYVHQLEKLQNCCKFIISVFTSMCIIFRKETQFRPEIYPCRCILHWDRSCITSLQAAQRFLQIIKGNYNLTANGKKEDKANGKKKKIMMSFTRKSLIIRFYSIAIYVHVIWCDVLPNSDNHTGPIMKFKNWLNQTLKNVFDSIRTINRYQH